jgi:hypothetical protein
VLITQGSVVRIHLGPLIGTSENKYKRYIIKSYALVRRTEEYLLFCYSLGPVAQLGEHLLCKQGVSGSIPLRSIRHERGKMSFMQDVKNVILVHGAII